MAPVTLIDLIRHGEPVGGRRYRGQIDDPLSERGWQQMWRATGQGAPWDEIVTSPLRRCHAFASALGERHGVPVTPDPRLQEIGFGDWEGLDPDELRSRDPDLLARFYHDPVSNRPAGAEPLEDFRHRVSAAFEDILQSRRGRHILVVTHAGVIRAVMAQVLDAPLKSMYRISVATAAIVRVRCGAERPPTLVFHGPEAD